MKRLFLGLCVAALVSVVGCSGHTSSAGGHTDSGKEFQYKLKASDVSIKQDGTETMTAKIDRGGSFKEDVKVTVDAPEHIKVDPKSFTFKGSGPNEENLKITAAKEAKAGDHEVTLKSKPAKGDEATITFKVTVK